MAKLRDRKELRWCLRRFEQRRATQTWFANNLGVIPRRFKQIYPFTRKQTTEQGLKLESKIQQSKG